MAAEVQFLRANGEAYRDGRIRHSCFGANFADVSADKELSIRLVGSAGHVGDSTSEYFCGPSATMEGRILFQDPDSQKRISEGSTFVFFTVLGCQFLDSARNRRLSRLYLPT